MSAPLFSDDVRLLQRLLHWSGFNPGTVDGHWGPKTNAANEAFEGRYEQIANEEGAFDRRSERNLITLHPKAQRAARRLLHRAKNGGFDAKIISGTRTYAHQDELYRQGRWGNPGRRVTNARGGQSNHNFGLAWDIGLFDGGNYLTDAASYDRAGAVCCNDEVEWGGHWRSFQDRPHYQVPSGMNIKALRQRFESAQAFA